MSADDLDFAAASAAYLRRHRLRADEIESALRDELGCSPSVAHALAWSA